MITKLAVLAFLFIALGGFYLLSTGPVSAQSALCVTNTTPRAINGLISNQPLSSGAPNLFGNSNGICVNNLKAAIPTFQIPSYDDLKTEFYDQFYPVSGVTQNQPVASATQATVTGWLGQSPNFTTNWVTGDVTISGINSNDTGVAVIFVGGKLNINGNITHAKGGLVFIVKGNISIDKSVTRVDAVLISTGVICTANDTGATPQCSSTTYTDPASTGQLVVNGSLVALNQASPIVFRRQLSDNTQPAELVNQQPKYLVLLKNLLSQTLTITTIGTNFAGGLNSSGPPLQVSCSASPNPQNTNQQMQWSATVTGGSGSPTFSWSSSDSQVNGKTAQSFNATYSSAATINASVTVTDSISDQATASCSETIQVPPPPPLTANCTVSPGTVTQGSPVAFNANPSGGTPPYSCNWSGGDSAIISTLGFNCSGNVTFPSSGTKNTGTVSVNSTDGQNVGPITCSPSTVTVNAPPASLTVSPNPATRGSTFMTLTFNNISNPTTGDFIGVYPYGTVNFSSPQYKIYTNTCSTFQGGTTRSSGTCSGIIIPTSVPAENALFEVVRGTTGLANPGQAIILK